MMVKSQEAFSWKDGNIPPCHVHSRIKLEILRDYLLAYFPTICQNKRIDAVNIELIDAFAGGGVLIDPITKTPINGSPKVILNAVRESEIAIAAQKTKPFKINARYHFADQCPDAVHRLRSDLITSGFNADLQRGRIRVDNLAFDSFLPEVLKRIKSRPRQKAIFFLDQCGWTDANLLHCNRILEHLPKAEIIWNISIEPLAKFANDKQAFRTATENFGVDLGDALTAWKDAKRLSDWRKSLISCFLKDIKAKSKARFVTPFMIQHEGWGYWLLHLSNHKEANDVMKVTHWRHQNHSLHEGFPGLKMLEFNRANWNQSTLFRFDADADKATRESLQEELGPQIMSLGDAPTVGQLIESVANETPADRARILQTLGELKAQHEFRFVGPDGEKRKHLPQSLEDRIIRQYNRPLYLPGMN
jgi:three-Cys-motif partner protein